MIQSGMIQRILQSSFIRAVAVLATGSIIAQAIPLLMLPAYARLYAPDMFALQALLMMGMTFMTPMATGFYEFALPSPKHPREARAIATVALGMALCVSLLSLVLIIILRETLEHWLNLGGLGYWMYAYPALILANACISVSNYWLLRAGQFKRQSMNRIALTAAAAIIAITLGAVHVSEGLLIGFVGGTLISAVWAQAQAYHAGLRAELHLPPGYFLRVMKRYREFPLFGGLPSSLNNLAAQVPLIILTAHYTLATTGHYAVARGLLSSGVGLVSLTIGQVLLKHFADRMHEGKPLWPYFKRISLGVSLVGLALSVGTYVLGPWFFRLYLGKDWQDGGDILRVLSFNLLFWLLGPATAMAAVAVKKLRMIALWQVLYLGIASSLWLFADLPFEQFMRRIVALEAVSYALYFVLMAITVRRYDQQHKPA